MSNVGVVVLDTIFPTTAIGLALVAGAQGWGDAEIQRRDRRRAHAEAGRRHQGLCGTFMDALGLSDREIMEGARRSTMDELAAATVEADKVLVF